jgi:hypothetical protein
MIFGCNNDRPDKQRQAKTKRGGRRHAEANEDQQILTKT